MTNLLAPQFRPTLRSCALLFAILLPLPALAENWQLKAGAQNHNMAHQALAFLPNEIWIHQNDTITWTFPTNEVHTVTFLQPTQIRPSRLNGCPGLPPPGATPDFSVYDGSTTCVNSGLLLNSSALPSPPTYSVVFPVIGNFKLVCLAHPNMTASIHVMDPSTPLPHDQDFYDREGDRQRDELLSDAMINVHNHHHSDHVTAGMGHIVGNAGGNQTVSVDRFMEDTKVIHVAETVEWTTDEAVTSHTITFGVEPPLATQTLPSANVTIDADGARHAIISSPSDNVHSGFITQLPQDRIGLPQVPLSGSATRFRVTFTAPGVYPYICVLHDDFGMVGKVIVLK